jgi:hypothetical protein
MNLVPGQPFQQPFPYRGTLRRGESQESHSRALIVWLAPPGLHDPVRRVLRRPEEHVSNLMSHRVPKQHRDADLAGLAQRLDPVIETVACAPALASGNEKPNAPERARAGKPRTILTTR